MADNLNAAQLQAIETKMRDALAAAIETMKLRKYAMDQAINVFTSPGTKPDMPLGELATHIYNFVAKPALDFKVEP